MTKASSWKVRGPMMKKKKNQPSSVLKGKVMLPNDIS